MNEEYLGTHIGKSNGLEYHLTFDEYPQHSFSIEAHNRLIPVGKYCATKEWSSKNDPGCFLDLEEMDSNKEIYSSFIEIRPGHRLQGLSGVMFNFLVKELESLGVIHLVSFSSMGHQRMKPRHLKAGYRRFKIKDHFSATTGAWYAKEY